jgi:hypothetical protein
VQRALRVFGSAPDDQFQVNTTTSGSQYLSAVAGHKSGHFIVAWTDYDTFGDQSVTIHGQRFAAAMAPAMAALTGSRPRPAP